MCVCLWKLEVSPLSTVWIPGSRLINKHPPPLSYLIAHSLVFLRLGLSQPHKC